MKTRIKHLPFESDLAHLLAGLAAVDMRLRWAVARARANGLNPDDEFRGLYISPDQVDVLLGLEFGDHLWRQFHNGSAPAGADWHSAVSRALSLWRGRAAATEAEGGELRLGRIERSFGLSPLETEILLLAIAPDLDPRYERFYAFLQDDVTKKRPSPDLLLNLLTDRFEEKLALRRLFSEDGVLFRNRLLLGDGAVRPAPALVRALLGEAAVDSRLAAHLTVWHEEVEEPPLTLAEETADRLRARWLVDRPPLLAAIGRDEAAQRATARYLAAAAGRPLLLADGEAIAKAEARAELLALLLRDGRLLAADLFIAGWDALLIDDQPAPKLLADLMAYPYGVTVSGTAPWQPVERQSARPIVRLDFPVPDFGQRLALWQELVAGEAIDLTAVANQFSLTTGQIGDAALSAADRAAWEGRRLTTADLLAACRAHSNGRLAAMATKIEPRYTWHDIVLPPDTLVQLKEMVATVAQRPRVYGEWGFGARMALGRGLNALFAGESGTGKTMSADIMAGALGLDLYKIDLSMLVSKYIGETEKNLDRIFTEAETSNAILFFDEADSIFGKRSEVKDSHDRYANIEISYLLQRMEGYDGVVILATNLRANLDEAFTRRLHFVTEFPFPEAADRERIFRVNVPPDLPLADDVDFALLARRFRLAGGNIRNIILAAAFLAAEAGDVVTMAHLLHATRREYQKMGRLIEERLFEVSEVR